MFKRVLLVRRSCRRALPRAGGRPRMAFNGYRGDYTTSERLPDVPQRHGRHPGRVPRVGRDQARRGRRRRPGAEAPVRLVCCRAATRRTSTRPRSSRRRRRRAPPGPSRGPPATASRPSLRPTATPPSSENYVGCSSCHYGANVTGGLATYGVDANDTAHRAPSASWPTRRSAASATRGTRTRRRPSPCSPDPDADARPTDRHLIQPQMALGGYKMLGSPQSPPATGWIPLLRSATVPQRPVPGLVADAGPGRHVGRPRQAPDLLEGL